MNKKDTEFFFRNGYFVLKNAVDKNFCEEVIQNAREVFSDSLGDDYQEKFYHLKVHVGNNYLKDLKNHDNLKYYFSKECDHIFNQVANTNINHYIPSGTCIASFKSNSDQINWHIDGWEHHFLTQNLHSTCVIAYTDTNEGTWVAPESIKMITELFYKHQFMLHCELFSEWSPVLKSILNKCKDIKQVSLKQGDILITHPFLLHAGNNNKTQDIRVITNFHLFKDIDIQKPKSLVELKIIKDLEELKLDPENYKLDLNKNLQTYSPWLYRKDDDKEYDVLKKQLIYFQNHKMINKDDTTLMKNNFNENNNKELDEYNKNIYKIKKKLFGLRPKNQ